MFPRYSPSVNWPSVRPKRRRFSVNPSLYWMFLAFTIFATVSWAHVAWRGDEFLAQDATNALRRDTEPECRLVRNVKDKCAFVRTNCPDHEDGLFSYLQFYYCSLADVKPLAFILLILWMCLIFNTIGIAASDFLCINLSTLASILGLSESLTGVTFLAFGNGSPDVFSTFAAMKSNSGSLAVGELIGAATFITSVVAGSMALVRPFKVARRSFVRDVGYFIIAVSFSMVFLADGRLHIWESTVMVALYCFYVAMVVSWHWYFVRQRRKYERNVTARSHFHIPENQELDIEEPAEDDDPGVGSESRSLLRAGSTEDFDALERSGRPAWTEDDRDEDDGTRNRYLAEIRENMHMYRPNSRRRNTAALNPIRPSLVGALEFQSILSSLQKSRNVHQTLGIDLDRYSDDSEAQPSQDFDNRSVASHSQVYRSPSQLSPHEGSARTRAVSANDVAGLKIDTSVFDQDTTSPVQVTVSRPSGEGLDDTAENRPVSRDALSPSGAGDYFSPSLSPGGADAPRTPDLLAPSDAFRSPNYQTNASRPRSPLHSPRGTHLSTGTPAEPATESPLSPFPPFTDYPESSSSRASSIRPRGGSSPTERLQVRDGVSENGDNYPPARIKWWPYWMLPSPQTLFSTLFPTLCDWKVKSIWERLLGIVAAPTVLLLTVTIPVIEPAPSETTTDPISVVVTTADDENCLTTPRVRLPDDSPVIRALEHQSGEQRGANDDGKAQHQPSQGRQRFNSEVPAVQQLPEDAVTSVPKEWNQWLVSVQLFVGPSFIALIAWTVIDSESRPRYLLPAVIALLFSLLCFTLLRISTRLSHNSQPPKPWRSFLALLGFLVAICWIATIAEEVVNLLKAIGVIMNISDSLLGLTVFAVGNSLGDLVADITVARLGYPVMALSACFGGPMMNILLGIGLGGIYMTVNAKPDAVAAAAGLYEVAISKVLVISAITLLITLAGVLIVVPLNGWRMDRKIGWGLVVLWCVSTLGNVIAEAAS
ncbi:sodium/calcium exchanger protein [Aspergillus ruber CBS 135680]|uniref:Sodium/calcium exchanger membrane region domain-containing protein n=1 Tax=Aspergillus ruber (strain CBS 135680) TaxID=1388766 RepID=A0A017S8Z3_ASPRC|nr:uncharacterized protein EURHEDRAFT_414499 [Aspergillus ruber CBS 135680]EYE93291.1 hypothetical protein EURHEDRAFT_414499 [Aspergillus ruber CBS 135680]